MRTRRNYMIENMLHNANMYCDNPEDILTSFELWDAQAGADSYEPDFNEQLEMDLVINESEEDLMTDFQMDQKKNFEEDYAKLQKCTTYAELNALRIEVMQADQEVKPDFRYSAADAKTFWAAYNMRKASLPSTATPEQEANLSTYTGRLDNAKDLKTLSAIGKEIFELGEKLKLQNQFVFSATDAKAFWAKYNTMKAKFMEPIIAAESKKVEEFAKIIEANRGNASKLKEVRNQLYHSKDLRNDSKMPLYMTIKQELDVLEPQQKAA
jgi:hypothetical protein